MLTKQKASESLWITVAGIKAAKWQRSSCIDELTGDIYAPAACSGLSETMVLMMAGFDGEPIIFRWKHLYVRTSWLRTNAPSNSDVYDLIEQRCKDAIANEGLQT